MSNLIILAKSVAAEILATAKVPVGVAISTTSAGLVQMFNIIPDDIGKFASLIGAVLAVAILCKVVLEIVLLSRRFRKNKSKSDKEK